MAGRPVRERHADPAAGAARPRRGHRSRPALARDRAQRRPQHVPGRRSRALRGHPRALVRRRDAAREPDPQLRPGRRLVRPPRAGRALLGAAGRAGVDGGSARAGMSFDLEEVRGRFPALASGVAFLDAPGGTQCPQSVIDAIGAYLHQSNANLGGAFAASRRSDQLVEQAHATAARFLGCRPEETIFGQNMTTLNFALTRALGRTLAAGDEILVTRLDHDGNIAPWLELGHDLGVQVGFVEIHPDTTLDLDDLERKLTDRPRSAPSRPAATACGTVPDAARGVERAHAAGALAWADTGIGPGERP